MNDPTYPPTITYTPTPEPPPVVRGWVRFGSGAWVPMQRVGGDSNADPGACALRERGCPVCAQEQQEDADAA